jgi:aminobenzoyl-glutamate transport protein
MNQTPPAPRGAIARFLTLVERTGNALPHPATLFLIFALLVLLLSEVATWFDLSAAHPVTKEIIRPVSLLTRDGLHQILTKLVTNFTGFAPLGTVLVALLGIGIAESGGLIGSALRLLVLSAPRSMLTLVVVFAGVISNTASEVGYVLLVPMAAYIFQAAGRHPIAGLAAAFAGVSGGYSANLLLGTIDPLLSGLTQEAARIVNPEAVVNPACNYLFLAASTFLVTAIVTVVTEKIVVPRLGPYVGEGQQEGADSLRPLTMAERHGLVAVGHDPGRRFPARSQDWLAAAFAADVRHRRIDLPVCRADGACLRHCRRHHQERRGRHEGHGKVDGNAGQLLGAGVFCRAVCQIL